ncbi:hypothetical protein BJX62DRAFT_220538 [Aspergillus germanicus]
MQRTKSSPGQDERQRPRTKRSLPPRILVERTATHLDCRCIFICFPIYFGTVLDLLYHFLIQVGNTSLFLLRFLLTN